MRVKYKPTMSMTFSEKFGSLLILKVLMWWGLKLAAFQTCRTWWTVTPEYLAIKRRLQWVDSRGRQCTVACRIS